MEKNPKREGIYNFLINKRKEPPRVKIKLKNIICRLNTTNDKNIIIAAVMLPIKL